MKEYLLLADRLLSKLEKYFTTFLMGAILATGAAQVMMRYLFNSSLVWSEELMRYMFIWMILVGAAVTFRNDGHIEIDFFTGLLPAKFRKLLFYLAKGLIIFTLLLLIPAGFDLAIRSKSSLTGALQLSRFWVYLSVPVGSLFMLNSVISGLATKPYVDKIANSREAERLEKEAKEELLRTNSIKKGSD